MKLLSGKKKGNAILDSITVTIVVFVMVLLTLVGYNVLGTFNEEVQTSDDFNNLTKERIGSVADNYPSFMDSAIIVGLVLLWIAVIIASFLLDTHPVFFIITVIVLLVVIYLAAVLSNTYQELGTDDAFSVNSFPMTNFVMINLPIFILAIAFSVGVVLFGKSRSGGGGI